MLRYERRTSYRFSTQAIAGGAGYGESSESLYEPGGSKIHDKNQDSENHTKRC